jgi:uncharacterized protein YjbJ (UPF0337 family)
LVKGDVRSSRASGSDDVDQCRRPADVGEYVACGQPRRLAAFPTAADIRKDDTMSTNRIQGAAKKAAGSVKEAAGKITGNDKLRMKGAVEKMVGTAQNALGKAQDKLGDALKHKHKH